MKVSAPGVCLFRANTENGQHIYYIESLVRSVHSADWTQHSTVGTGEMGKIWWWGGDVPLITMRHIMWETRDGGGRTGNSRTQTVSEWVRLLSGVYTVQRWMVGGSHCSGCLKRCGLTLRGNRAYLFGFHPEKPNIFTLFLRNPPNFGLFLILLGMHLLRPNCWEIFWIIYVSSAVF
jgi:hypothetical protein